MPRISLSSVSKDFLRSSDTALTNFRTAGSACLFFVPDAPPMSASSDRPDDAERLLPTCHGLGQAGVQRVEGDVLAAGEVAQHRPPRLGGVVTDRPAQHPGARLEGGAGR